MKTKLICAAAAAVIAVSTAVVATAYGNSAKTESNDLDLSVEEPVVMSDAETAEDEKAPEIAVIGNINDENVPVEDEVPVEEDNKAEIGGISVKAVNAVNDDVIYTAEFGEESMSVGAGSRSGEYYYRVDDSETALGYLKEYFNSDAFPVDDKYKGDLLCRYSPGGKFTIDVAPETVAKSPVDGKVISVSLHKFNGGLGSAVAVEFDDNKIFIMSHFESVSVKAGDEITAGQPVGVCGDSGMVEYGKTQLGMILMEKQ